METKEKTNQNQNQTLTNQKTETSANQNQIKKEVVLNLEDLTIAMKAQKLTDKEGNEKIVIAINGRNYMGNYTFKLPIHIAYELIRILESQQNEVIEKLKSKQSQQQEKQEKQAKQKE